MNSKKYQVLDFIVVFLLWIGLWSVTDIIVGKMSSKIYVQFIIYLTMIIIAVIVIKNSKLMERLSS